MRWIEAFAASRGLRYEAEADERWLRAWEPYTTLKTPIRYEHALSATGGLGSLSIARAVVELEARAPAGSSAEPPPNAEVATWIAIVQDERIDAKAAVTSDFAGVFGEPLDLVLLERRATGDPAFDHVFASFAETGDALARVVTPSLRRLLIGWRVPVHAELRPGGFVLAPVSLGVDARGLSWLLEAVTLFGAKATKGAAAAPTKRAT